MKRKKKSVLSTESFVQEAIAALSDPNPQVNEKAIWSLVKCGDSALRPLVDTLLIPDISPKYVDHALRVIELVSDRLLVGFYCGSLIERVFPRGNEQFNSRVLKLCKFSKAIIGVYDELGPDGKFRLRAYYFDPEFEECPPYVVRWRPPPRQSA